MLKYFHKQKEENEAFGSVIEGLKKIYKSKLLPLEQAYKFHEFHSPPLDDSDFESKPMVLLVGQYSTGKTTFIRYLLESDFPGIRIGPEPTTDSFIAVKFFSFFLLILILNIRIKRQIFVVNSVNMIIRLFSNYYKQIARLICKEKENFFLILHICI